MFANYSFCYIFYHLIQFHPWIGIISGGVAETKEAEDLRKKEKEENKKKKKVEKKKKKEEEKKKKKEIKNQDKEEQDREAMRMEEIEEDSILKRMKM